MPDLTRIQSLIVHRALDRNKAVLFFRFGEVSGARAFVRECLTQVPAADETPRRAPPVLHLSLSWKGLSCLAEGHQDLTPEEGRSQLEPFFVDPLPTFPGELGFVGNSAPKHWWCGAWSSADIDLALHGFFADEAQATAEIERLRSLAASHDVVELRIGAFPTGALTGETPAGGILHFGFRDGISKPDIDWTEDGSGSVDFREILLGYRTADYPTSPFSDGPWRELVRDGSMACIAWIGQDVASFSRFLREEGRRVSGIATSGIEEDWLAARMMGRWRDGSPVMRWPDAPPSSPDLNDGFDYAADPEGRVCPLTSHVRIANLRSDRMNFANLLRFPKGPPRFVRRGFSYGPPLVGGEDDGVLRGLVGTFFCARVNEQFFTVLRWMQATTFNDEFARSPYSEKMQDAMFGARQTPGADTHLPISHDSSVHNVGLRDFITFHGVTYLLMPSIPSLALLADNPGRRGP